MRNKKIRAFDVLGNVAIVNFPLGMKVGAKKKFALKLMREQKQIKTVLEKIGKVKGRLRKPTLKYIAGDKTKEVLYKENDCVFRFNVDTTYFSPRLSNERKEIASKIKKNENVLVMFAGVAPFSVVIAKNSKARKVVSVELNREANKYAKLNVELNKLKDKVEVVQGDVKKFVGKISDLKPTSIPRPPIRNKGNKSKIFNFIDGSKQSRAKRGNLSKFDVIVMPRPQLKNSFLEDAFRLSKKGTRIYYYDFCKVGEEKLIVEKIQREAKECRKRIKILKVKKAGEIAPYKIRCRFDFRIV